MLKLPLVFLGLLGSAAIAAPVQAQMQRQTITPRSSQCDRIYLDICYQRLNSGTRSAYMRVSVGGSQYTATIFESGEHNVALLANDTIGATIAYVTLADDGSIVYDRYGQPIFGAGDIGFMLGFEPEFTFLLEQKDW